MKHYKKHILINRILFVLVYFYSLSILGKDIFYVDEIPSVSPQVELPQKAAVCDSEAPLIDGKISDKCWQNATKLTKFTCIDSAGAHYPKAQTEVYLAKDKVNMYILFICHEPFMDKIKAEINAHDTAVWLDDSVEMFFDTEWSQKSYYHIIINSRGVSADYKCTPGSRVFDIDWNPELDIATSKGKDHWIVEVKIPFNELIFPQENCIWGVNFVRSRWSGDNPEHSTWANIRTGFDFHQPEHFGNLFFNNGKYLMKNCKVSSYWGDNIFSFAFENALKKNGLSANFYNLTDKKQRDITIEINDTNNDIIFPLTEGENKLKVSFHENNNIFNILKTCQIIKAIEVETHSNIFFQGESITGIIKLNIFKDFFDKFNLEITIEKQDNRKAVFNKKIDIKSTTLVYHYKSDSLKPGEYLVTISIRGKENKLSQASIYNIRII